MSTFNRITGVIILEVRNSNPNGDPDRESEPRMLDLDERGIISPVSFKRKLRDLVADKEGEPWLAAADKLGLTKDGEGYDILETRYRDRKEIEQLNREEFTKRFWDGRVFGNTFLESMKDSKKKPEDVAHFISTGTVQFGVGVSVAPIEVVRMTQTNKAGVQEGKDRGMAPLGFRAVVHGVYTMPFFVNPMMARRNGCTATDIELMKFLIPHAYSQTASAIRPEVFVLHAWCAEHKSPLGSCPDPWILDALTPKMKSDTDKPQDLGSRKPSRSLGDYTIPPSLPHEIAQRLASFSDLCVPGGE